MWDVAANGFDSMDAGSIGILELANLSLDKPILEASILSSGANHEGINNEVAQNMGG